MVRTATINQWGQSLGIRIPSDIVKEVSLKEKMRLEFRTNGEEIILTCIPDSVQLEDLIAMCPEWDGNPPDKINWGEPVGREIL